MNIYVGELKRRKDLTTSVSFRYSEHVACGLKGSMLKQRKKAVRLYSDY